MDPDLCQQMNGMSVRSGRNWSDLPAELKVECIKRMDFETRWELRNASRIEKELVESTKCEIRTVDAADDIIITYRTSDGKENHMIMAIVGSTLKSVLKMGIIDVCKIFLDDERMADAVRELWGTPLNVKDLTLSRVSKDIIPYLTNFRGPRLKFADIRFPVFDKIKFSDLKEIHEMMINVDFLGLVDVHSIEPDYLHRFILSWICNNKEAGSRVQMPIHLSSLAGFQRTVDTVKDRFTRQARGFEIDGGFRISMNEDKFIFLSLPPMGLILNVVKI